MSNYQMHGSAGGFFARGDSVQWSDSLACDSLVTELESMNMADPVSQWNARAGPQSSPQATGTGGVNSGSLLDSSGPFNDMNPFIDSRGSDEQAGVSAYASDMLSGTGTLDMLVSGSGRQGHRAGSPRLPNPSQLGPIRDGSDSRSSSREISRSISREMPPPGLPSISDGQVPVGGARQPRDKQSLQQQQRGQGYRKLWQQVTKVGRGQKLGEGLTPEVTVEDLVRAVMALGPQEPAVSAVEPGLQHLDSSALAALLKELSKQGHIRRAVEIFDWLRGLPPDHDLHRLCDLYTYTTMISQCGSHQHLRRALELVAEMRGRGIPCNVHTYSALMNVCIKANELELAQDVFKQMVEEGVVPNLVTYNILIDVHVKNGQWEEALSLLDTLEQQGIAAEARTYNTVISACNRGGQHERALAVYDRMLAAGVKPSATTYTALISAYGKRGMVEKAMEIFEDMSRFGCERNVITYSSLISACEKGGRWELALDLLARMQREGVKPNTVTYNSLVAACAHHSHLWDRAEQLFEQMQTEGCKPDGITYAALIAAYEKGGQWMRALRAHEGMQMQGIQPDAPLYNSLMEVLWQSGILLAQARAFQLWATANRNGQFRIFISTRSGADSLQYSAPAYTTGAICVTALRWIVELRSKLVKDGPGSFRSRVSLSLQRSRQQQPASALSRSGSGSLNEPPSMTGRSSNAASATAAIAALAVAQEALATMLGGANSPFVVQVVEGALMMEALSAAAVNWLRSAEAADLTFLAQGNYLKNVTQEVLFHEDGAVAGRCQEAFSAVRRFESLHSLNVSQYCPLIMEQRGQVVAMAIEYTAAFGFRQETMYDGLQLFDKTVCSSAVNPPTLWPLALLSAMLLAARNGADRAGPWPSYDQISHVTGFGTDSVVAMERNILVSLKQDLGCISVLRVVQICLERLGYYVQGEGGQINLPERAFQAMHSLLIKVTCSTVVLGVNPSLLAAATVVVLRRLQGSVPSWPMALQLLTGYPLNPGSDLHTCVIHVESLLLTL